MSKAVLVLDMPKNCAECEFAKESHFLKNEWVCCNPLSELKGDYVGSYVEDRPNKCPLCELPQKKSEATATTSGYFKVIGYNACIDEILKGSETE